MKSKTLNVNFVKGTDAPIYIQLANQIREGIKSKKYLPGEKFPCEIDLAAEFGVSTVTIHRSLRTLAEEGLLERKRRAGTFVSSYNKQKAASPDIITLVVTNLSDVTHPLTGDIVRSIESTAKAEQYNLTFCCLEKSEEEGSNKYGFTFPMNQSLAGAIIISQEAPISQCGNFAAKIPVTVLFNVDKIKGASGIEIDLAAGCIL